MALSVDAVQEPARQLLLAAPVEPLPEHPVAGAALVLGATLLSELWDRKKPT